MNEPLKGKIEYIEERQSNNDPATAIDVAYHSDEDIKSAVEWLKESLSNYWGKALSIKDIQKTTDLINQAFEDVTKSNKEK